MVTHTVVKCNYCEEKILLRFQLGYFDIYFDFYCPKCGVSINGKYSLNKNNPINLIINNAKNIGEYIENTNYYGNFSAEFPSKKISKFNNYKDILNDGFGPFMSSFSMLNSKDNYFEIVKKIGKFVDFKYKKWNDISALYDLYYNGNDLAIINKNLKKICKKSKLKNELDIIDTLHLLTMRGMYNLLTIKSKNQLKKISRKIYNYFNLEFIKEYIEFLNIKMNFKDVSKKVRNILIRWIEDFEKYIPTVLLNFSKRNEILDRKKYGITTTSFENIKSFYADSYELILEMIVIPIGLNNIFIRGGYNNFFSCDKKTMSFDNLFNLTKIERMNYLLDNEIFTQNIEFNRNIRNSIAHYNYEIDKGTQKILFVDKYKNKENTVDMYLFDLSVLCFENIKIIIYLNELLYSLRKIELGDI